MAGAKRSGNTAEAVRRLAEPIAEGLGLSIWDVRYLKEGAGWFLRIFIDKPDGVGIDDCEAMSRAVNAPLDALDPIEGPYCLEVSSPGVNRELLRDEHFAAFLGAPVRVRLIRPDEAGRRTLDGTLRGYAGDTVTLAPDEGKEISLPRRDISWVRVMEDDFVGGIEE